VIVACVLLGTAASLVLTRDAPTYQADVLVYARQLNVNPKVLPALGEAVFANGAVEAAVAEDPALAGDRSDLTPERLSVVAAEDSIVLVVQARDEDPATAAALADRGAAAFADQLNDAGAGVGRFAIEADAVVPTEPLSSPEPTLRGAIGAVSGLFLGIGLVGLIAAVRRPVITSEDVAEAVGVPLLGTVELPRAAEGVYHGPRGVRGIATVTRWLAGVPAGRLLMISHPSDVGMRHRVYVMVAVALGALRTVRLEAPGALVDAIGEHRLAQLAAARTVDARPAVDAGLVLVDGGSALELVDPGPATVSVVAVAAQGVSRGRLRTLTSDFVDGGLVGVVLVDVRLGSQWFASRRAAGASSARSSGSHARTDDERESEPEPA
jgi:hypothetical protein